MDCEEGDETADQKLYPSRTLSTGSNSTRNRSNQVGYYYIRRECSKAQMCLQKILHIISSIPRQESCVDSQIGKLELDGNDGGGGGFCIDFNLRLGAPVVEEDRESVTFVENGGSGHGLLDAVSVGGSVTEKSSEGECDVGNVKWSESPATKTTEREVEEDPEVATEKILEQSGVTTKFLVERGDADSSRIDENESKRTVQKTEESSKKEKLVGSSGGGSDDGRVEAAPYKGVKYKSGSDCLGLLIEAARLILGEFVENDSETESTHEDNEFKSELETEELSQTEKVLSVSNSSGSKRKLEGSWMVMNLVRDMEDRSPVVRSKRGRSQVLPCRYRDSVLEPWRSQPLSSKVSRRQRKSRCRT